MGDTFNTATDIAPGLFSDSISIGTDDYFKFSLQQRSAISLALQGMTGNADFELYSSSQLRLDSSTNPGSASELLNLVLNAGTYYVRVAGASTSYTLNFQQQAASPQNGLVWRDYSAGSNGVWWLEGTTIATLEAFPTLSPNWVLAAVTDWNNDGELDLLWREQASGMNSLWYMAGTAIASYASLPTVSDPWIIAGVADFNSDGHPDLCWREPTSGINGIWYMNGTEIASTDTLDTVPGADWVVGGIADFNQDGQLDLLWRDALSGINGIWYMNGAAIASYGSLPSLGGDWLISGVMDWNGDQRPDLVWQSPSSGTNAVWYLADTTLLSYDLLPSIGGSWRAKPVQRQQPIGPIDSAGNTAATAFEIGVLSTTATYREWASSLDTDWYKFTIQSRSNVTGATIINAQGQPLTGTLDPGTYYARVTGNGAYTLTLTRSTPPAELPLVSVQVTDAAAGEPNNPGTFTLTRTGATTEALTVSYGVSGTATNGTDYVQLAGVIVIPAGASSATIAIAPIDDTSVEGSETVTLTLSSSSAYAISGSGTGTVVIADNDDPPIPAGDAGNTPETAKSIGTLGPTKSFSDRVDNGDKNDLYRFTVTQLSVLEARVSNLTADLDIELLDLNLNLIAFSDNSGPQVESLSVRLNPGDYYLWLYPYGSAQSDYLLEVSGLFQV